MRQVELTTREFYSFKQLASFYFELYVKGGIVFITADAEALDALGY